MTDERGVIFLKDGSQVEVRGAARHVSDGSHSFNDLYQHRCLLFIALMKAYPAMSWRSLKHADGSAHDGRFIAGMRLPTGDITYHLPRETWYLLDGIETPKRAPEWDGHTADDVLDRLRDWQEEAYTKPDTRRL